MSSALPLRNVGFEPDGPVNGCTKIEFGMKSLRRTRATDGGTSATTACSAVDHEASVAIAPGSDRMLSNRHGGAMRRFSWDAALVGVLSAAVLIYNFGSRLLITNDDARFPVLARDAIVNGHWLVPALPDGRPHIVKPPLAAWLIALASWPEGHVSVRTAVLPSLLAAIGVVLLTYWLGRRLFGASAGVVAGLTVTTMLGMYTMAHSPMPDMLQLLAGTAAIAAYAASGFGATPTILVLFYAVIGLGSLAKGAPGFVPLAVAVVDAFVAERLAGLRRLISLPGWLVLAAVAVPWWIAAAGSVGYERFVSEYVLGDQGRYFVRGGHHDWWAVAVPLGFGVTVLLPWSVILPAAVPRAVRERDPDTRRKVRLLLLWLTTVFVIMAVSGQQRERYYLPLCPVAALLIGWWYSTLAWRWRARGFAAAWIAVVVVGAVVVAVHTPRYNATTDLRAVQSVLPSAPTRVFALDLQDLALSFNLERPVVNCKNYQSCEERVRDGEGRYVLISDRLLEQQPRGTCLPSVATGLVTRRPFAVLDPTLCSGVGTATSARPHS
jgi:4-amino-4-deoxy-L-arabinose transferase-like glycosyltransferase